VLFVQPGQDVYKGQIVGIHQRPGDLAINVCKKKAATNVRSNKETTGRTLFSPQQFDDFPFFPILPELPCNDFLYCELALLENLPNSVCNINDKFWNKNE
jgi:hypothetical protein